jgi:hypothetical protein
MGLNQRKTCGRGRLVPMRLTGIAYQVRHCIRPAADCTQFIGTMRPAQWTKCSVHLAGAGLIPNGRYFLYADEGGVHQLELTNGQWYYLAAQPLLIPKATRVFPESEQDWG